MMNNHLVMDTMKMQQIKTRYDEAESQKNTEGMEAARKSYQELIKKIKERGKNYEKVFKLYEAAAERGNDYIDLNDVIWDKEVAGLIASLRENGIEHFTFSSTWSSTVETAWLFTKNGCTLKGMVQINSAYKAIASEEYERIPAYLFEVH